MITVAMLALYGGLALCREMLAIFYYRAIIAHLAGLVSVVNLLIELLDFFVLSLVLTSVIKTGNFVPALVYAGFSSLGSYIGVKLRKKK
jgi:hypothetical protein